MRAKHLTHDSCWKYLRKSIRNNLSSHSPFNKFQENQTKSLFFTKIFKNNLTVTNFTIRTFLVEINFYLIIHSNFMHFFPLTSNYQFQRLHQTKDSSDKH